MDALRKDSAKGPSVKLVVLAFAALLVAACDSGAERRRTTGRGLRVLAAMILLGGVLALGACGGGEGGEGGAGSDLLPLSADERCEGSDTGCTNLSPAEPGVAFNGMVHGRDWRVRYVGSELLEESSVDGEPVWVAKATLEFTPLSGDEPFVVDQDEARFPFDIAARSFSEWTNCGARGSGSSVAARERGAWEDLPERTEIAVGETLSLTSCHVRLVSDEARNPEPAFFVLDYQVILEPETLTLAFEEQPQEP